MHKLILNMISQHPQVYLCVTNIAFWDPNSASICANRLPQMQALLSLHRANGMSDKQFVYADHAVFSTSIQKSAKTR